MKIDNFAPLNERIARLDRVYRGEPDAHRRTNMEHFVDVMSTITHTQLMIDPDVNTTAPPVLAPEAVDELVETSRLLGMLSESDPDIVSGPTRLERQVWIAASVPLGSHPTRAEIPMRELFVTANASDPRPSTKPFGLGMFTSTLASNGETMWRVYLESYSGPSMFPRPWNVWELRFEPLRRSIFEIASATDWVRLLGEYGVVYEGRVYPDWLRISQDYDGVHLTARAVVAVQGFSFVTTSGPTAAAYWDVESTLWLAWRVADAGLLEALS
jgi:hypothetical protein